MAALKPQSSGAVGSVLWCVCFVGAAVCISVSVVLSEAIGTQFFFVLLAGITSIACLWSTVDIMRRSK